MNENNRKTNLWRSNSYIYTKSYLVVSGITFFNTINMCDCGRTITHMQIPRFHTHVWYNFCYLGDMLSAGGGCMAAATARCRCAWGKFRENLPLLTSKPVPFDLRGRLFSSNVRSLVLHGTETWPMTSAALHRQCRKDRAMIRWICGVKPSDDPSMDELHAKLGICDLAILVRERRLRWFGHVMRSNGEINRVRSRPVPGRKGPGRPKKTWEECVKQDLKVCGLSEAGVRRYFDPHDILTPGSKYRNDILTPLTIFWPPH